MTITKDTSISYPVQCRGAAWRTDLGGPTYTTQTKTVKATRTRTGTRLNKWREVIATGGNATTSLTARFETRSVLGQGKTYYYEKILPGTPGVRFRAETSGDILESNNTKAFDPVPPTMSISFVDNLARAAFYKKLHQIDRQFQGLVFLGELGETLHMLKHPAQNLMNLSKDFLGLLGKRKKANPKKWINELSGLWLEQSFGWNPLINDIKDAVKAYDRFTQPVSSTKVSAGAQKYFDQSSQATLEEKPGSVNKIENGAYWRNTSFVLVEQHIARYKGALIAELECPRWGDWSLFGFQPQEFVPAAWELLPWSFLIDYFTNIGDILDASITSTRKVSYVNRTWITKTIKQRSMVLASDQSDPAASWKVDVSTGGQVVGEMTRRDVTRAANSGYAIPSLQFNFSLSDGQLGNCAALLGQASALHPQTAPRKWHR